MFACTPGTAGCNIGSPHGRTGKGEPLGAVRVAGSTDLSFSGCTFTHIGSAYALSVLGGSKRVTITGNTFTELSGGFLKLGSVGSDNTNTDESGWDELFTVTNNVARAQAVEFGGAPGYFGGWIAHSTVSHNTVSDARRLSPLLLVARRSLNRHGPACCTHLSHTTCASLGARLPPQTNVLIVFCIGFPGRGGVLCRVLMNNATFRPATAGSRKAGDGAARTLRGTGI